MYNRLLKQAREAASLSQEDLAEAVGTTASTVSDWERGLHEPSPYFREKLSSVIQRSLPELGLLPKISLASSFYDPLLPLPISLVGRQEQLTWLRQSLLNSRANSVVLFGLPGVGKTALVTALAYDQKIRKQFDGILWMGLGPQPNSADQLLRWGKLLGLSSSDLTAGSTADALRSVIGERSILLIIDDVWKREDVPSQVGGPNCRYVFTTRFSSLAPCLSVTSILRMEELNQQESMSLLRTLAPEVIEREETKALPLVEAVGGLPLALTLMGNYLRTQGYSGQSRRLQTALRRLSDAQERLQLSESSIIGSGRTELSLQATLALSDQLLSEAARKSLYKLSLTFPAKPQTFSEQTALAAGASVEALDLLVDTGFLECHKDRYTVHQVVSDYARLHLLPERTT